MTSTNQQKIRTRLRRYERKLRKEKEEYGCYRDGGGARYQIGPHYMLLEDNDGAVGAYRWFAQEFPDDIGEPSHLLCWSLALHRAGDEVAAAKKLRQTMFSNLYLVPHLVGAPIEELDIWHGSNWAEPEHIEYINEEYLGLWCPEEREWAAGLHESSAFRSVRDRYIEIGKLLKTTPRGATRSRLCKEMYALER